jgi:hypothetical protein
MQITACIHMLVTPNSHKYNSQSSQTITDASCGNVSDLYSGDVQLISAEGFCSFPQFLQENTGQYLKLDRLLTSVGLSMLEETTMQ